VPLVLFSEAAQTLPLVAMALLQYLSPSIKFAVAVLFLGESLSAQKLVSYGLVWVGVAIFTAGSLAARRRAALAS
jgi:chloramphenicol-sensitive protein RarD